MATILSAAEVAAALGVSVPRVHSLLKQNRIAGAKKIGQKRGTWTIPVNADGLPKILPSKVKPRKFSKIESP